MKAPAPTAEVLFDRTGAGPAGPDLVTVGVSLFNYAHFLPICLTSVAAQHHHALELVVVDDDSTDGESVAVALEWMGRHSGRFFRTRLLRHGRNQGLAQTRNTAFRHALGKSVFVLDADNELYPRAIGRLHDALQTSGAGVSYSQLEIFGDRQGVGLADVWRPDWLRHGNYIDAMALVLQRAWRDVDGYTHIEGGWEDYDFWCKLIEQGYTGAFVPEMLCRYRVHGTSMLRTETARSYDAVFVAMTLRHPWLRLEPIAAEHRKDDR